jgi:activator of 2-hydroxyglutaryl-CoA dehydratase
MLTHILERGSALGSGSYIETVAELLAQDFNPVKGWALNKETRLASQCISPDGTELIPLPVNTELNRFPLTNFKHF